MQQYDRVEEARKNKEQAEKAMDTLICQLSEYAKNLRAIADMLEVPLRISNTETRMEIKIFPHQKDGKDAIVQTKGGVISDPNPAEYPSYEDLSAFLKRYRAAQDSLEKAYKDFDTEVRSHPFNGASVL